MFYILIFENMELERLLVVSIICNVVAVVAFVVCWFIQGRMNRKSIEIMSNFLEIIKWFKAVIEKVSDSVNEAYLNLAWEIDKAKKEIEKDNKAAVFAVGLWNSILDFSKIRDVCNDNIEKQGRGNKVQWTEGDRPRRKYTRRNNAA